MFKLTSIINSVGETIYGSSVSGQDLLGPVLSTYVYNFPNVFML